MLFTCLILTGLLASFVTARPQNLDPWDQENRNRGDGQNIQLGSNNQDASFTWGNQGGRPFGNQGNQGGRPFNNQGNQGGRPFNNQGNQVNRPFGNQGSNFWDNDNNQGNAQNNQNGDFSGDNVVLTSSTSTTSSSVLENTTPPNYTSCMNNCQTITNYNPVCGTDNLTYNNQQRLNCAINCGLRVQLAFPGTCEPL